jgi:hypothetical protein
MGGSVIMEYVIIILTLLITALGYGCWNLLRKLEKLEEVLEQNTDSYIQIYNVMKEIDSTGAFESDDEVGSTFSDLKNLIDRNKNVLNGKS